MVKACSFFGISTMYDEFSGSSDIHCVITVRKTSNMYGIKVSSNFLKDSLVYPFGPGLLLFNQVLITLLISSSSIGLSSANKSFLCPYKLAQCMNGSSFDCAPIKEVKNPKKNMLWPSDPSVKYRQTQCKVWCYHSSLRMPLCGKCKA